jgi:3-oxoacyl-[acyl-carrier-protein] synthase I
VVDNLLPMAIIGGGMVTAVGFNMPATCAAIRAGISGIRQDNIWDPTAGDYIGVGRPRTPQWWEGPDMLAELAAPAIMECLAALPQGTEPKTVPIFVLLCSTDRPYREPDLNNIVLVELKRRLQLHPNPVMAVFDRGRTGILPALHRAAQLFTDRTATYAIVVGVDTFLRQRVVETYIEQRRVLTSNNSNGFIPGEAACAVLLAPQGRHHGGELRILGWGEARETGTIGSENPLTGDGLTQALRSALTRAGIAMADTDYWLTDQNAEHYKAKECTVAQIRLERRERPAPQPYQIWQPIEYLGEIGSAIAPCLLGEAFAAAKGGYAPGPLALMHVGEDYGERVALVLQWATRT